MSPKAEEPSLEIGELRDENRDLRARWDIAEETARAADLRELAAVAGRQLCRYAGAAHAVLLVSEEYAAERFRIREFPSPPDLWSSLPPQVQVRLREKALSTNRPWLESASDKLRASAPTPADVSAIDNVIGLPLLGESRLLGSVLLFNFPGEVVLSSAAARLEAIVPTVAGRLGGLLAERRCGCLTRLLEAALERSIAPVALLDRDFNFLFVNDAYASRTGMDREDLLCKNHFDLFPDDERRERFRQAVETGQPALFERDRYIFADLQGDNTYWNGTLVPIRGNGRDVSSLVLSLTDVTEQVHATEYAREETRARRREEHLLATILDNARPHMAYLDQNLCFVRANAAYAEVTGYSCEELEGKSHFDVWQNDEGTADLKRVLAAGEAAFRREHVHYHPQRGKTYWDWSAAPIKDEEGGVVGVLISAVDVTEQVQARQRIASAEQERAREARLLEVIVENIDNPLAYLDRDLRLLKVNSAYCKGADYSKEQLVNKKFGDLFPLAPVTPILEKVIETGERFESREMPKMYIKRPDWGITYWDSSVIPVKDQNGETEGVVLSSTDVTKHVKTRERMLAAERERTRLAENLAAEVNHRMKNNLSMVAGLLQMQIGKAPIGGDAAGIVRDAIARIRTFSAVHEQLYERQARSVELLDAMRRIAEVGSDSLSQGNVDVKVIGDPVSYPPRTAMMICVMANELITNAIKHGAANSNGLLAIEVSISVEDDKLHLSVWNHGRPLPADFDSGKDANMGLRLIRDMTTNRYKGEFKIGEARDGVLAEIIIDDANLRDDR